MDISGASDQSSFGKKFSKTFSISPKEAHSRKDWSLLIPPLTWDVLSCNANENAAEGDDESTMKTQTVFGVSKEQYDKIIEVHDLEGLYGFEPMFSQVAVEVAEAAGICLADAFRYADSLRDYGGDFSGKEDDPEDPYYSLRPAIENLREAAHNEFFQFAFFKCNISVSTASGLDLRTGLDEDELMRLDPAMLHEYALIEDFNFKYFTKAYNYYMQHKPEDYGKEEFYQFLDMISLGHFVEEALEYVVPEELDGIDFTSAAPDYEEFEEYDSFRREEEENERWSGVRIDQEYDEENPEYL